MFHHQILYVDFGVCFLCNLREPKVVDPEVGSKAFEKRVTNMSFFGDPVARLKN